AIAAAQGIGVVNGGYTYDTELVELLSAVRPGVAVVWAETTAELGLAQALMENEEFDAAADLVRQVLADEARTALLGARERSRLSFAL
ncbi:hypothetical protein G3I37_36765, partial [Streptomyces anulatus]|nr:hypothetical protein [Streptomyces anulatus]